MRAPKFADRRLPSWCFTVTGGPGVPDCRIVQIHRGSSGYNQIPDLSHPQHYITARKRADELNESLGITREVEDAMVAGSMFGWHIPAADYPTHKGDSR